MYCGWHGSDSRGWVSAIHTERRIKKYINMNMKAVKTKGMIIGKEDTTIEQVDNFKYLGTII